jgi:hypothetical protein
VTVADDGRLMLGGKTMRGTLAISNFAVRAQLTGAAKVARGADYELWRPQETPRMALFVGGLSHTGWLAPAGHVTVWPARNGRVEGMLRVPLSLPAGTKRTVLRLEGPGVDRRVAVSPGQNRVVTIDVDYHGPWTLSFHSSPIGYLQPDETPVSVRSATPMFSGRYRGIALPRGDGLAAVPVRDRPVCQCKT